MADQTLTSKSPTELYRYFAAKGPPHHGRLLYVGISLSALKRALSHRNDSEWMTDAARMTIERFPTREAAALAEIEAIQTERPVFNVMHAPDWRTDYRALAAREEARKAEAERQAHIERMRVLDAARASFITPNCKLTVRGIAGIVRTGRPGLYGDGYNLFLKISESGGSVSWVFRYARNGKVRSVGLGPLHTISLKEARVRAYQARQLLHSGIEPRAALRAQFDAVATQGLKQRTRRGVSAPQRATN